MEESISTVINETADDRSPQASDEELVSDEHEREDVSTTTSDGDVNPRWSKECKKKTWRKGMETEVQETLDSNTVHNIDERISRSPLTRERQYQPYAQGHAPDRHQERKPENKFYGVANGSVTEPRGQEEHVQGKERIHAVDELQGSGRDQRTGIGEEKLPEREQSRVR